LGGEFLTDQIKTVPKRHKGMKEPKQHTGFLGDQSIVGDSFCPPRELGVGRGGKASQLERGGGAKKGAVQKTVGGRLEGCGWLAGWSGIPHAKRWGEIVKVAKIPKKRKGDNNLGKRVPSGECIPRRFIGFAGDELEAKGGRFSLHQMMVTWIKM